jgi:hypothetical protein
MRGSCIYLDNWYIAPNLLCARNTDTVGTMRSNRKELPEHVKQARLKGGELETAFQQK